MSGVDGSIKTTVKMRTSLIPVRSNTCTIKPFHGMRRKGFKTKINIQDEQEPPTLSRDEVGQVFKYKRQKQENAFNIKECEVILDGIKRSLTKLKGEIETVRNAQEKVAIQIKAYTSREELIKLNDEQLQFHRRLLVLIDSEDKLMSNLESQRRALAEAKVNDQTYKLDMENKIDNIYKMYETRETYDFRRRIAKEKLIKKNANLNRSKALKSWASSYKNQAQAKRDLSERPKNNRPINEKVQQYIRFAMTRKRMEKVLEQSDKVMRQSHRHSNLITLRNRIYDQKDVLWAEAQDRQKRAQRRRAQEQKAKQELIDAGENPYISAKIMKVSQKQRQVQQHAADVENSAIKTISDEYDQEAKQKERQEKKQLVWAKFWNKLAREKRKKIWEKNQQFFSEVTPKLENREEAIPTALTTSDYIDHDTFNFELVMAELKGIPYFPPPPPPNTKVNTAVEPPTSPPEENQKQGKSGKRKKTVSKIPGLEESRSSGSGTKERLKGKEGSTQSTHRVKRGSRAAVGELNNGTEVQEIFKSSNSNLEEGSVVGGSDTGKKEKQRVSNVKSLVLDKKVQVEESIVSQMADVSVEEGESGSGEPAVTPFVKPILFKIPKKKKEQKLSAGPTFKWNPQIITFQDFAVGKAYKKKVTVTNLSPQIVKFYFNGLVEVLPTVQSRTATASKSKRLKSKAQVLPEELPPSNETPIMTHKLVELVQVDFTIPNPLSPGLSHVFTVTFKPASLGDWRGKLCFESSQGNFFIPIQCLKTRLVPILTPPKVIFQHVVGETSTTTTVKLLNKGEKAGVITRLSKVQGSAPTAHSAAMALEEYLRDTSDSRSTIVMEPNTRTGTHRTNTAKSIALPPPSRDGGRLIPNKKAIRNFIEDLVTLVTESTFVVYVEENQRRIEAGEHIFLKVHFHPLHTGSFSNIFEIQFDDPEVDIMRLEIEGSGVENPLSLVPLHTNLKICMFGFNYQQPITIKNVSKSTGRIHPYVDSPLRNYVHLHPKEMQLFASSSTQFSIKFHPSLDMLNQPGMAEFYDKDTQIMDFPVYFGLDFPMTMPGPLECTFQAILTEATFQIEPAVIDLGICLTTETVKRTISIYNPCFVPQHLGFVELPEYISIQPNNGFGTVLPLETRKWDILLSPPNDMEEGEHHNQIKVQSLEKVELTLQLSFIVKILPISLSHSRICFPATSCGGSSSAIIEIFSTAAPIKTRGAHTASAGLLNKFEFMIDESYPINIKPRSGNIEPGKSTKLLVTFTANVTDDEIRANYIRLLKIEHEESITQLKMELEAVTESLRKFPEEEEKKTKSTYSKKSSSTLAPKVQSPTLSIGNEQPTTSKLKIRTKGKEKASAVPPRKKKNSLKLTSTGTLDKVKQEEGNEVEVGEKASNLDEESPSLVSLNSRQGLRRRQTNLIKILEEGVDFIPPQQSNIQMDSVEVGKAKRDLMNTVRPRSQAFTIPCVVRDPTGVEHVLLLNLKCPMQKPDIILLDEESSNIVNFDLVAIGSKNIREVHLYNVSTAHLTLTMDIVNPYGPFMRVNALRRVAPGQVFTLKLQFLPMTPGYFEDSVTISGGESRIELVLTGSSSRPAITLFPNKSENTYIGSIELRTLVFYKFELQNDGDMEVEFQIVERDSGSFDGPEFTSPVAAESSSTGSNATLLGSTPTPESRTPSPAQLPSTPGTKKMSVKNRRLSKDSRQLGTPDKSDKSEIIKKKRRRSVNSSIRTSKDKLGKFPSYYNLPFEILDGTNNKTVGFEELISYLERENQPFYFCSQPNHAKVGARQKVAFEIGFVPMMAGRFFKRFNILMYGQIVKTISVVGVGFENTSSAKTATTASTIID